MTYHANPSAGARGKPDVIPPGLLWAMLALAVLSLALVTFSVLSGRAHVGVPRAEAISAERDIVLVGHGAKAVTVTDTMGNVVLDLDHGGFVAVIQNGLDRARKVKRVDANAPVRLVRYANGRLAIIDPATGWSAELGAFGNDNRAAFERLMKN